ncbi:MAG: DNA mismatch repair protein MutS [Eubacterium sp.]|nr:DNA mismatch repair protein MutS [Eubacterium sp.]
MPKKYSPMMEQYFQIKNLYQDCVLFYRVGDFYEMFYDDALEVSRVLELTLTGKNCGQVERAPMCGVPYHAADTYIHRLVEKGYKVAICEQVEDPASAKGLVKRDVIKIVTPGTLTSQMMLNENENNYLAAIYYSRDGIAISYCDISTGELKTTEVEAGNNIYNDMVDEVCRIGAKEIIISLSFNEVFSKERLSDVSGAYIQVMPDEYFSSKAAKDILETLLGKGALSFSGIGDKTLCQNCLGALLSYLLETQKQGLNQITNCVWFELSGQMSLDKTSLRNLEITETLYEKKVKGSLLGVLDKTKTAMGARLIKKLIRQPLNDSKQINERLDAVEEIYMDPLLENNLLESLKQIYDFERLAARIASGTANGKDLIALKKSIFVLPEIKSDLSYVNSNLLNEISSGISNLEDIGKMIDKSISEDAGFSIKEGGLIISGYSQELDDLKASIKEAKAWIAGLESHERERTGIKTLKVGYNKVFGYYIDVTRANSNLVPDNYIRKQTLVNNERYITPELKETENLVFNAETKINKLEYEIFVSIRNKIEAKIKEIQSTSRAIALLDVICSFASVSRSYGYTKPIIDESFEMIINGGRHPVVEQMDGGEQFVSNETYLNNIDSSMMIITGPNMSGKSTYMRQTALIVLMAQAGCFVPCDSAKIGVVDRIFTRIGASDNLSSGQSTFFVEMSELSYILSCATDRSLIILDEIGRGTSTYDGLSIAWSCVEYLCNAKTHIRTLFATHYHELTVLANEIEGVKNLNVDVSEENGNIIFLHKIVPGAASRSYGIHVAKLAGVPKVLLKNAELKLAELEENSRKKELDKLNTITIAEENQLSLFMPGPGEELIQKIKNIDIMNLTPAKAIEIIGELKESVE